jgi:hypothetical protein
MEKHADRNRTTISVNGDRRKVYVFVLPEDKEIEENGDIEGVEL